MPNFFVWIKGVRGPEAQLWESQPVDGNGRSKIETIFCQKLSDDERNLSLDQLILKFKDRTGE